ncbi:XRE family transcriptional regulator [Cryobacterium frigoriphilum]|uniref:XRE family transcriptional regulator n=2 Tax=Cryobacterium frigoriphilum TaxID=1259150 RepID=A0A4R9AA24_9MICO|nr:helix-turn-helix transcriptional regulator [Cryobacterium frigoriphilum]TFD54618.1 XRE family transcriptional regulator [Cryobacterium frigoriphilum]
MNPTEELGEFLRTRRAQLTPEAAGITPYGARRVPGLRREELAQLAGVSATYYTRLEQGQSTNASESVIDSIGRALNLSDDEKVHLHDLARPATAQRRAPCTPEQATPGTIRLLKAMTRVPTVIMGRRNEVLAWNPLGHLLVAGHADPDAPSRPLDRPNLTRMLFLDPHTKDLYRNWRDEASLAVASLRFIAAQHQDDAELTQLIGELTLKSSDFAAMWTKHPVHQCVSGIKRFHHPEVGDFDLSYEVLHLPGTSGHRMMTHAAEPGSTDAAALELLAAANETG